MKLGNPKTNADVQMSEAFVTSVFLALSGGFQDAYTYFTREEVFFQRTDGKYCFDEYAPDDGRMAGCVTILITASGICIGRFLCREDSCDL